MIYLYGRHNEGIALTYFLMSEVCGDIDVCIGHLTSWQMAAKCTASATASGWLDLLPPSFSTSGHKKMCPNITSTWPSWFDAAPHSGLEGVAFTVIMLMLICSVCLKAKLRWKVCQTEVRLKVKRQGNSSKKIGEFYASGCGFHSPTVDLILLAVDLILLVVDFVLPAVYLKLLVVDWIHPAVDLILPAVDLNFDTPSSGFDPPSSGFDPPSCGFVTPSGGFEAPGCGFHTPTYSQLWIWSSWLWIWCFQLSCLGTMTATTDNFSWEMDE